MPIQSRARRLLSVTLLTGTIGFFSFAIALNLDFPRLQQALVSQFGSSQLSLFEDWQKLLTRSASVAEQEKLRKINDFVNSRLAFADDFDVWGQSDYWATPIELIGKGRGDCEDFSIAKYYSLIQLGVPVSKLRLVYVKAILEAPAGQVQQAHMVLAYYATPNADPLVLDNLVTDIRPASRRSDLSPIFSFNSAGLWQGTGNQSSKSHLSRWQDLLARARAQGFE